MEHVIHEDTQPYPCCHACKQPIKDFYLLSVHPDVNFHENCLKCLECGEFLVNGGMCFFKDGRTYCKMDHDRLFRVRCELCNGMFTRDEMVMWANASSVYHIQCFKCSKCNKTISTGDKFSYYQKKLYCSVEHYMDVTESSITSNFDGSLDHNNNTSNIDDSIQQQFSFGQPQRQFIHQQFVQRHQKRQQLMVDEQQAQPFSPQHLQQFHQNKLPEPQPQFSRSTPPSTSPTESVGKPPRYRTPMTEAQLSILKSFYKANSRPDGPTRENLARMTGHNVRVIRVWFQNKRCKDKRDMDKGDKPCKNV